MESLQQVRKLKTSPQQVRNKLAWAKGHW